MIHIYRLFSIFCFDVQESRYLVSHRSAHLASMVDLMSYKLILAFFILRDHISKRKEETRNITGNSRDWDTSWKSNLSNSSFPMFGTTILTTFTRAPNTFWLKGHDMRACWIDSSQARLQRIHCAGLDGIILFMRSFTGRRPCNNLKLKDICSLLRPFSLQSRQLSSHTCWGLILSALHGINCKLCWFGNCSIVTKHSVNILVHWRVVIRHTFNDVFSWTLLIVSKKDSE